MKVGDRVTHNEKDPYRRVFGTVISVGKGGVFVSWDSHPKIDSFHGKNEIRLVERGAEAVLALLSQPR